MMHGVTSTFWWPWFGVIAGVVVLIGVVMLYSKPGQSRSWGLIIVILAALNMFLDMGGFLASVLGIIGGALALAWRPEWDGAGGCFARQRRPENRSRTTHNVG
jgi:hypothetical protein